MTLSDKAKAEFERRKDLKDAWSLAVLKLRFVSDIDGFLKGLREHVKKYDGHVPPDVVVESGMHDEYLIFMRGPQADCLHTLCLYLGNGGFATNLPKDMVLGARMGIAQYARGMSSEQLLEEGRSRPFTYEIGEVPAGLNRVLASLCRTS
jgi:hypothetical protein